ncbi:MAG: hypothetical protein QFB87_00345 [Patescibacteria group bacterium]|nr:hypothetical protein [Patescibacteria group bacterium]
MEKIPLLTARDPKNYRPVLWDKLVANPSAGLPQSVDVISTPELLIEDINEQHKWQQFVDANDQR